MYEFDISLALPGNPEAAQARVAAALERFGYRVLGDNPMQAKRAGKRWGFMSNTVDDYPRMLTVGFKAVGEGSTLATFVYEITETVPPAGWRRTLAREAEAIAALAAQAVRTSQCATCGEQTGSEIRYCRRCGAPIAASEPAEIEVHRLTSQIEAARLSVMIAAIASLILLVAGSVVLAVGASIESAIGFLAVMVVLYGAGAFFGIRRLNEALNPPGRLLLPGDSSTTSRVLPPPPGVLERSPSVTEHTTEFLDSRDSDEESQVRIATRPRNTA